MEGKMLHGFDLRGDEKLCETFQVEDVGEGEGVFLVEEECGVVVDLTADLEKGEVGICSCGRFAAVAVVSSPAVGDDSFGGIVLVVVGYCLDGCSIFGAIHVGSADFGLKAAFEGESG